MTRTTGLSEALLPPYAALLGLQVNGNVLKMPYGVHLIGSPGRLHGGSLACLLYTSRCV